MLPLSARSTFSSHENALTRAVLAARRAGRTLLDLTASNPTTVGFAWQAEQLWHTLEHAEAVHYAPEPFGLREARASIAQDLRAQGFEVPVAQIMLTASTSEAYGYLFKLLCDPGDVVLVPTPSYPLLDVVSKLEGVRLQPYRLRYDGEWHVDPSVLALAKQSDARAIVTVHPNNPTGSFLKASELSLLAECGLPILSDEVFAEYPLTHDPRRVKSALEAQDVPVFRLSGLSKSLALPQLKLAYTAFTGPRDFVEAARVRLEHIADTYLSPSTPVQLALGALLAHGPRVRREIARRCQHNLQTLKACVGTSSPLTLLRVEGGFYAIVRLPEVLDEEQWALTLLAEDDVITQPGYFYDLAPGAHLVLSLITPEDTFRAGVERLCARALALTA
jgi:aspartate/methionine/tyrosine aminotransferase